MIVKSSLHHSLCLSKCSDSGLHGYTTCLELVACNPDQERSRETPPARLHHTVHAPYKPWGLIYKYVWCVSLVVIAINCRKWW